MAFSVLDSLNSFLSELNMGEAFFWETHNAFQEGKGPHEGSYLMPLVSTDRIMPSALLRVGATGMTVEVPPGGEGGMITLPGQYASFYSTDSFKEKFRIDGAFILQEKYLRSKYGAKVAVENYVARFMEELVARRRNLLSYTTFASILGSGQLRSKTGIIPIARTFPKYMSLIYGTDTLPWMNRSGGAPVAWSNMFNATATDRADPAWDMAKYLMF